KTEVAGLGSLVVSAGVFSDIQSRYADGAGGPDDLHRLVQHDCGLIATSMALGFEAHRIDDRIHRGLADDRGDLLAKPIVFGEIYRDEADLFGVAQPGLVHVADHDHSRTQELGGGGRREAYRAGACDVDRRARLDARTQSAVKAGRQDVRQHGQIHDLGHRLILVREFEQVEIGIGDHDVAGLSADPVHIAISAIGATGIDRQAYAGIGLTAGATSSTNDVERHGDEIAQRDHLDIRALLYHLARDLVPEHHACRGSRAAADHVLIRSADIRRNHLQDHAVLDLAAARVFELGIGDILDLDFSWLGVDDTTIFAHDNLTCSVVR